MKRKPDITTEFIHRDGRIVISTGIGDKLYMALIRKDNGIHKRFKPIPANSDPEKVRQAIEQYAERKNSPITKGLPVDPALNAIHLDAGLYVTACGKNAYNKETAVFLSQVTCQDCKASDLYRRKNKIRENRCKSKKV